MSLGVRYGQDECQDALLGSFPLTGICLLLSSKRWKWVWGCGLHWEASGIESAVSWPKNCSANNEDANGTHTSSHLLPETYRRDTGSSEDELETRREKSRPKALSSCTFMVFLHRQLSQIFFYLLRFYLLRFPVLAPLLWYRF